MCHAVAARGSAEIFLGVTGHDIELPRGFGGCEAPNRRRRNFWKLLPQNSTKTALKALKIQK